jgi:hypothetical protein
LVLLLNARVACRHLETRFRDCGQVAGTNGSFAWAVGQWFKIENLKGEGLVLSEDGGKRFLYFDWGVGLPARFGMKSIGTRVLCEALGSPTVC